MRYEHELNDAKYAANNVLMLIDDKRCVRFSADSGGNFGHATMRQWVLNDKSARLFWLFVVSLASLLRFTASKVFSHF